MLATCHPEHSEGSHRPSRLSAIVQYRTIPMSDSQSLLIPQWFPFHQNRLHPILRLLHTSETEERFTFEIKHILLCDRCNGRTFTACYHSSQVTTNYSIMLTDLASKQQVFNLLLQHQTSPRSWQEQHRRLGWLPCTSFMCLCQTQSIGFCVAQQQ